MKKAIFILSCLLLVSFAGNAQKEILIGARGGLNIPQLTASGDNPMSKGYSSRLAGNAGIFAEFRFTELFSVQPMIEYTQQGGRRDGLQAIPPDMMPGELQQIPSLVGEKYLYANFKSETVFNNLMIPVLAKFGYDLNGIPVRVYANAGPFVSFLLNAKQITKGQSLLYLDPAMDMTLDYFLGSTAGTEPQGVVDLTDERSITSDVYRVNYGVSANIGASYEIRPRHNILLEVGGNYGFRKLQKNAEHGQNRIGAATVVVGYAYRLK